MEISEENVRYNLMFAYNRTLVATQGCVKSSPMSFDISKFYISVNSSRNTCNTRLLLDLTMLYKSL